MNNFCITQDCGRKVENRDLGLCATCNKARRNANKPQGAPKQRKALPFMSKKKAVALGAKKQAYAIIDSGPRICVSCGSTEQLSHSHVLSVKQFPQHEANPANIFLQCLCCHSQFEHNKPLARKTQASWDDMMLTMLRLEPQYFALFCVKFSLDYQHYVNLLK